MEGGLVAADREFSVPVVFCTMVYYKRNAAKPYGDVELAVVSRHR